MSGRQIKAGTEQAQLAGFILRVAVQVEHMLLKGKLAQYQGGCQECGCEPVLHCATCFRMRFLPA